MGKNSLDIQLQLHPDGEQKSSKKFNTFLSLTNLILKTWIVHNAKTVTKSCMNTANTLIKTINKVEQKKMSISQGNQQKDKHIFAYFLLNELNQIL